MHDEEKHTVALVKRPSRNVVPRANTRVPVRPRPTPKFTAARSTATRSIPVASKRKRAEISEEDEEGTPKKAPLRKVQRVRRSTRMDEEEREEEDADEEKEDADEEKEEEDADEEYEEEEEDEEVVPPEQVTVVQRRKTVKPRRGKASRPTVSKPPRQQGGRAKPKTRAAASPAVTPTAAESSVAPQTPLSGKRSAMPASQQRKMRTGPSSPLQQLEDGKAENAKGKRRQVPAPKAIGASGADSSSDLTESSREGTEDAPRVTPDAAVSARGSAGPGVTPATPAAQEGGDGTGPGSVEKAKEKVQPSDRAPDPFSASSGTPSHTSRPLGAEHTPRAAQDAGGLKAKGNRWPEASTACARCLSLADTVPRLSSLPRR